MAELSVIANAVARSNKNNIGKAMSLGMKVSAGYIALGTVADAADKVKENNQVKHQRKADLKALRKQQHEQMKYKKNKKSVSRQISQMPREMANQLGQLPLDMFNQRIGHTNMGNSKYTR